MPYEPDFVIGSGADHLGIRIEGRTMPEARDEWDGNWLHARVALTMGAFKADYSCALRADEFQMFHQQLSMLPSELRGTATFSAMEEQLGFRFTGDGLGHFDVSGHSIDRVGDGHRLDWRLEIDQTYIPRMLSALEALCQRFPVRGR